MADLSLPIDPADEQLLRMLGSALGGEVLMGATDDLALLAERVAMQRASLPARRQAPTWSRRARRALSGVVGAVIVGAGSAVAAGASMPEPLRVLAVAVGIPVTPPAVATLQARTAALAADLRPGAEVGTSQTARDAEALARAMAAVDAARYATQWGAADRLLDDACLSLSGRAEPITLPAACNQWLSPQIPSTGAPVVTPPRGGTSVSADAPFEALEPAVAGGASEIGSDPPVASTGGVDSGTESTAPPTAGDGTSDPAGSPSAATSAPTTASGSLDAAPVTDHETVDTSTTSSLSQSGESEPAATAEP